MLPADSEIEGAPDSPNHQVPHNDQTTAPVNTNGPIVADEFTVCVANFRISPKFRILTLKTGRK
jgi:hypothetical protein